MVHHQPKEQNICLAAITKSSQNLSSILIKEISQLYHELSGLSSLSPNEHVNALFTKLVQLSVFSYDQDTIQQVLMHPFIVSITPTLRSLASQGEYLLELYWAKDLTTRNCKLERFVYYKNYKDLVQLEIHSLLGIGASLNRIVFIGSGPLPLSSILMYQAYPQACIHNVDRDSHSISISNQLLNKLKVKIEQYHMDALDYPHFDQVDIVILAALVGLDAIEKMKFLKVIGSKMKQGSILMVRSAHSFRRLLYPSLDPFEVNSCGFETMFVLHPHNDVVNSILIAKKL
ncbi:hypothetical protein G6F37_008416 [Rhizopus arrhizus]|nr:hypothetical protein G6F38_010652 [Rhizopus arrhizus]KAG1155579.1 hypothetical protein G6F37_008416 [Rhizopus arrhizus]